MPPIILSQKCRTPTVCVRHQGSGNVSIRREPQLFGGCSPDMVEGVVDGTFLRPALMLFEIGLQLRFGFIGVRDKFPSRPEC
jgi:hypothetical protein